MDGGRFGRIEGGVAEEVVSPDETTGFWLGQVAGAGVNVQDHVSSDVMYGCLWIRSCVVQNAEAFVVRFSRGICLLGNDRSEG